MVLIHTAALLPLEVRDVVEKLAMREDRTLSAQMRQLTLRGLEVLGEWPPKVILRPSGNVELENSSTIQVHEIKPDIKSNRGYCDEPRN
jgi:hypothetical protein